MIDEPQRIAPDAELDFRILGPLEVRRGAEAIPIGGIRRRALLAALLINPNEQLSSARLIDELWGDDAPPTAGKMIQNSVWQLRRLLEPENGAPRVLVTRGHGYELRIAPEQVDAKRFERLLEEGKQALASGEEAAAARTLREALGLWHGGALADFAGDAFAQAEIARLEELRLNAI